MKTLARSVIAGAVALCAACAGTPVSMGTRGTPPPGASRIIKSEACGFQLLLLIPIAVNNRAERAYRLLEAQAAGDFITDVRVRERWIWGFVGTTYCTILQAKAIHAGGPAWTAPSGGADAAAPAPAMPAPPPAPVVAPVVAPPPPPGPAAAPLKAQPKLASETIGTVPAGVVLAPEGTVTNSDGSWQYVKYGGVAGWIRREAPVP